MEHMAYLFTTMIDKELPSVAEKMTLIPDL